MVVAGSTPSESFDEYDVVVDDLSEAWEFINATSSDDDEEELDDFSLSEEEEDDPLRELSSGPSKEKGPLEFGSPSSDISMDPFSAQLHLNHDGGGGVDDGDAGDEYGNYKKDDDEDYDDYDDGHDLDDELVPWGLSDKFGRQRIRKLGKRAGPKVNKAKRLAYRYNRPGCVHGKHGFGVQHCYI